MNRSSFSFGRSSATRRRPRSSIAAVCFAFCGSATLACGSPGSAPELGQLGEAILGGSVDEAHPEVMLLADAAGSLCTGTNIFSRDGSGFLLTAAHCVTEAAAVGPGVVPVDADRFVVVPGTDFSEVDAVFPAEAVSVEPNYDGSFASDDVAIVRFAFGDGPEPGSIPALGANEDELAVDDGLLLVGYGQTELAGFNTERREVARSIGALEDELVGYSQEDGNGACFGDSGGPGLVEVDGEERVGMVISGGVAEAGDDCESGVGIAMRVSAYADFIDAVLSGSLD